MNLLSKLTIKNLKLNKKRTIMTIVGITLSVALITAVSSLYSSGIKSLTNYEILQKGRYHVAFYNVPVENVYVFENNKEVKDFYLTKDLGYSKIDSKNEYKPYAFVKSFTKDALENLSVRLVSGRFPENSGEILIPTHLKTNGRLNLKVGDTITLNIGKRIADDGYELGQDNPMQLSDYSEEEINANTEEIIKGHKVNEKIIDASEKNYKIVGIIERPDSNIESYSAPGYTFITYEDEKGLKGNVDLFALYTKDGVKDAVELTGGLLEIDEKIIEDAKKIGTERGGIELLISKAGDSKKYEIGVNGYLIDLETNPIRNSDVSGLGIILIIVISIIIFTSVFCIKNSFSISITEKIKQYGMLRSIGATKKQIKKNVLFEGLILGLIGIPLGILCGFIASYLLVIVSNYFLHKLSNGSFGLEFVFPIMAVIISIILGAITIYFSALGSAIRASKISPIESIKNSADIKIKRNKVKSPKIIKKLFGIGGEISYKNLKRNKRKYRTTVFSLITSVFVFIALSSFMTMAYKEVKNELNYTEYNLSLTTKDLTNEKFQKFSDTTTFDNIEDFSIIRNVRIYLWKCKV